MFAHPSHFTKNSKIDSQNWSKEKRIDLPIPCQMERKNNSLKYKIFGWNSNLLKIVKKQALKYVSTMCASKRVRISCLCTEGYIDSVYSVTISWSDGRCLNIVGWWFIVQTAETCQYFYNSSSAVEFKF